MRFAIIGNIEGSRNITSMKSVMKKLNTTLEELNEKYKSEFVTPYELTIGDEFQALFKNASHLLDTIFMIRYKMYPINIRFGVGVDEKGTVDKHGTTGKAWYRARDSVMYLKMGSKKKKLKAQAPIIFNTSDSPVKDLINEALNTLVFIESMLSDNEFQFLRETVNDIGFSEKPDLEKLLETTKLTPTELKTKLKTVGYLDMVGLLKKTSQVIDNHEWRE